MNTRHVFVTGASGFIGRRLCLELANQGLVVHGLCRNIRHPFLVQHENIRYHAGDILDKDSLRQAARGCSAAFHTAALAKMWTRDPDSYYRVNVVGTRYVLEACAAAGMERMVYTSTCGIWGPTRRLPMSEDDPRMGGFPIHYERTKYLAELEIKKFLAKSPLQVITVNPSRVFGPGPVTDSNTVGKMVRGYLNGTWRIIPGSGRQVANYAYLDDVVQGHLAAMRLGRNGERYILGGEDISFNQFFDTLAGLAPLPRRMLHVPVSLIKTFSWLDWLKTKITGLPPVFLPEFADRLRADQKYTSRKAIRELGYQITPFGTALHQTLNHFKSNQS